MAKVFFRDGTQQWIMDRYGLPVETIALFTGGKNHQCPSLYRYWVIDSRLEFQFRTHHIFENGEAELLAMDNVFALVVWACQKALGQGRVSEDKLAWDRMAIAKALLGHKLDHERIARILVFLKNILYVDNEALNRKFDETVWQLSNKNIDMRVIEIIKKREREEGGHLRAITIAKKLKEKGLALVAIAEMTGLPPGEIEAL